MSHRLILTVMLCLLTCTACELPEPLQTAGRVAARKYPQPVPAMVDHMLTDPKTTDAIPRVGATVYTQQSFNFVVIMHLFYDLHRELLGFLDNDLIARINGWKLTLEEILVSSTELRTQLGISDNDIKKLKTLLFRRYRLDRKAILKVMGQPAIITHPSRDELVYTYYELNERRQIYRDRKHARLQVVFDNKSHVTRIAYIDPAKRYSRRDIVTWLMGLRDFFNATIDNFDDAVLENLYADVISDDDKALVKFKTQQMLKIDGLGQKNYSGGFGDLDLGELKLDTKHVDASKLPHEF